MAGGDVSGCLEVSSGYGSLTKFSSGHFGISFDCTGGTDERIWAKDPTVDATNNACYLEYVQLAACGTMGGGPIALTDGSGGATIVGLAAHDGTLTLNGCFGAWDFRDDPLVCLTADNTQSLCVSSTSEAQITGFIKCYWGPLP